MTGIAHLFRTNQGETMSKSHRKINTDAFTSALKQVFYIHKNVVSELCAQLDVLSDECKLLQANSHRNPPRSGRCESCVSLEKINRTQQEQFNSLLHEKNMDMKELEEKLQFLTGQPHSEDVTKHNGKILSKEMSHFLAKEEPMSIKEQELLSKDVDVLQHAQGSCKDNAALEMGGAGEADETGGTGEADEPNLFKGHTRLSLARHSKRNCHAAEEQRQAKRRKVSPPLRERGNNESVYNLEAGRRKEVCFVPDTDYSTQQRRKLFTPRLDLSIAGGRSDHGRHILVIPETLAVDNSSYSDNEGDHKVDKLHDQKEPVSDTHDKTIDGIFLGNLGDKMLPVTARCGTDDCSPRLEEKFHEASNNCGGDESPSVRERQPGSERICSSKSTRILLVQDEGKADHSSRQPNSDKENDLTDMICRRRMLQSSLKGKVVEECLNEVPHEKERTKASKLGGSPNLVVEGKVQQESPGPRRTSPASVGSKSGQVEQENTNSNSVGLGYCVEKNGLAKPVPPTTVSPASGKQGSTIKLEEDQQASSWSHLEKLQTAIAIQRSLKCTQNKSPGKASNVKVDLESKVLHSSPELGFVLSKHKFLTSPRKDILLGHRLGGSLVSHLLPGTSCATSTLEDSGQEETTSLNAELNGSMNPNVHLSEFLISQMGTERHSETFGNLDETIAPNLISQYILARNKKTTNLNKLNAAAKEANQTPGTVISNETSQTFQTCSTSQTMETSKDQTPPPVVAGTPSKCLHRQSLNEGKHSINEEWCDTEDDDDDNIFTCVEDDDPETIQPSPHAQSGFHLHGSGFHLHGSGPSISCSFKFIHKQPQFAGNSAVQGTGKASPSIASHSVKEEKPALDVSTVKPSQDFAERTVKPSQDFAERTVLGTDAGPPAQSFLDSFDRIPRAEVTEFPHISVVRKRNERDKLEGFACKQCFEYYQNIGLSEEELKQKKNECSRHRERYRAPDTPEHFWSLGFPDTAEMFERRQKYDTKESPVPASRAPRRRRRLEQKF